MAVEEHRHSAGTARPVGPVVERNEQSGWHLVARAPILVTLPTEALEEGPNGKLKFSRNGHTLTLHSHGKDVEVEEIMHIRHFLDTSKNTVEPGATLGNDVMVVLDHSGARIFLAGAEELKPVHVVPLDPSGHDQQVHNPNGDSGGKQGPLRKLFHEALAKKLQSADRILLIGDGHGASNEVEHFVTELQEHHHKDLAGRIVGTEVADISHMTDGAFVAKAREFFSAPTDLPLER